MKLSRRSAGHLILMLLCASPLVACGSPGTEVREEPALGDIPTVTNSSQVQLPLARYLASPTDEKAYFSAVNVAQRKCATSFGVSSSIPAAVQPPLIEIASSRRYGIVNADEVERYGYRPVPSLGAGQDSKADGWNPDQREALIMNAVTPGGESVITDPVTNKELPKGGCSAEGFRRIDKDDLPPPTNALAEDLLGQAWERTKADSRAITAETKWADCMRARGYDFKHRWEAGNSVGQESLEVQLQMAKQDLRCAMETNYVGIWYAVDFAYQNQLIDQNEADLSATVAQHQAVMERVTRALEGSS